MMMEIRGKMVKNASYAQYRAQQVLQMHEKIKSANTENIYESFTIQWLPRLSVLWLKKRAKNAKNAKNAQSGP